MGRMATDRRPSCPRSSLSTWTAILVYLFATTTLAANPTPLSLPVDNTWLGYDGNWSPITIRVGTPEQWVYVLPNVLSQETWVIGPGGCDGTFTCEQKRGGLFNYTNSSSWQGLGPYELGFDTNLGISGGADYGYDEIALNQQVVSPGQIVGILNSTEFWTGYLGLGVEATDFTDTDRLTFLSSLVQNQSVIPSHSYGYTAGAYYRLKNVPASLTFGGVDTNRFVQTDTTFALDSALQPVVAINAITVSAEPASDTSSKPNWTSPLSLSTAADAALFTIDSSTPFLWLPEDVCDRFAEAFGLYYNETLQLYTFEGNSTGQSQLPDWGLTFTFTIADLPGSSNSIELTLPYETFDLELTYPFPTYWANYTSPAVKYFPVRKAANSSQLTIGRMFLQETYLTVDYERNNFSLSQAKFSLDALTDMNLVEITRPAKSSFAGPQTNSSGPTSGTKTGIGIGVAFSSAILIFIITLCILRQRSRHGYSKDGSDAEKTSSLRRPFLRLLSSHGSQTTTEATKATSEVIELPGSKRQPTEVAADKSNTRFELSAPTPVEMEGSVVPSTYYTNEAHRARRPGELAHNRHSSTSKVPDALRHQRTESHNLPAYTPTSPSDDSISPNSLTRSNGEFNTMSSSDHVVSPTTARGPPSTNGSGGFPSPNTPGISDGSGSGSGSLPSIIAAVIGHGALDADSDHHGVSTSSSDPGVARSASNRSSGDKEEDSIPSAKATEQLGDDSGYRIREPGPEEKKFDRITRLLRPTSRASGDERKRFSWEEQ